MDPMKYERNKFESEIQHCFDSNQKKTSKKKQTHRTIPNTLSSRGGGIKP